MIPYRRAISKDITKYYGFQRIPVTYSIKKNIL